VLKFKHESELALMTSGLPYTIFRPSRLTDGPYTSYDLNTLLQVGLRGISKGEGGTLGGGLVGREAVSTPASKAMGRSCRVLGGPYILYDLNTLLQVGCGCEGWGAGVCVWGGVSPRGRDLWGRGGGDSTPASKHWPCRLTDGPYSLMTHCCRWGGRDFFLGGGDLGGWRQLSKSIPKQWSGPAGSQMGPTPLTTSTHCCRLGVVAGEGALGGGHLGGGEGLREREAGSTPVSKQ
jgi:hypothetical protein